jgi:hypothetical protein
MDMPQLFGDWRSLMSALHHWFNGGDPYGPYIGAGGWIYEAGYFAYPPPVLLLGAPLALLPWWLSLLLVQSLAVAGFELWARRSSGRSALLWLILFPPLLQGLQIGQTTLLALAALMLGELSYRGRQDGRAGLLLALALLKPQVGALAIAYLLFEALRARRWRTLGAFGLASAALWGGAALVAGPQIYAQWLAGLQSYQAALPDRPMLFLPLGPLVALAAAALWRRSGRDYFGLALLVNTLVYPLSVIYIVSALAFLVIRWRRDWEIWPLALCWLPPLIFARLPASPDALIASVQAMVALGLAVGLMPALRRQAAQRASSIPGQS